MVFLSQEKLGEGGGRGLAIFIYLFIYFVIYLFFFLFFFFDNFEVEICTRLLLGAKFLY